MGLFIGSEKADVSAACKVEMLSRAAVQCRNTCMNVISQTSNGSNSTRYSASMSQWMAQNLTDERQLGGAPSR
jgi:hypothetical protein